jgi:hypothetical protein
MQIPLLINSFHRLSSYKKLKFHVGTKLLKHSYTITPCHCCRHHRYLITILCLLYAQQLHNSRSKFIVKLEIDKYIDRTVDACDTVDCLIDGIADLQRWNVDLRQINHIRYCYQYDG